MRLNYTRVKETEQCETDKNISIGEFNRNPPSANIVVASSQIRWHGQSQRYTTNRISVPKYICIQ